MDIAGNGRKSVITTVSASGWILCRARWQTGDSSCYDSVITDKEEDSLSP